MTYFLCSIGTNRSSVLWSSRLNQRFAFVSNFLSTIGTDWTSVLWSSRLNQSFTLMANFLGTIGTDWTSIFWICRLNSCLAFMTYFLCSIGTNRSSVLWISRLNQRFAFMTDLLGTFSANWSSVLWICGLNSCLTFMTWLLCSFFPTDSLTIPISCPLTNCIIFFHWRLKPLQSILQRLFKLRLSRVTQITHILITINGNNTLSQIFFIWNRKSLIIGLQLLVLQGKNLYRHKETLPCGPNQDQANNFFTMFFWK